MPVAVDVSRGDDSPLDPALERLLQRAVAAAAEARDVPDAEFSLTLLDDVDVSAMNLRFLGHDGPTDVISFALFDPGEPAVGDIYIGEEQARRQALDNGVPLDQELARLAVHGTLHALGEDHPEGEERVESGMWALQERIVASLFA